MKSLDRELERGLETLLRPLLMPPTLYVLGVVLIAGYVWWRSRTVLVGAFAFAGGHRVLLVIALLAVACICVAALLGFRWALRKWQVRAQKVDLVADWPELAEGLQLAGSSVLGVKRDQVGLTVRLQLNRYRGQTSADLVARLPRLESALRVRPGAVRVLPDAQRADLCTLRVIERDPLAKSIPWTTPALASITEPITLGLFEDHRPVEVRLWEADRQRHVLIAGVNGAGKSGLINVALGSLARCCDVVIWGVDLKGGMEFSAWQPVLDRLATSPAQAGTLLEAANRALNARMEWLAARRWRRWQPSAEEPLLLIVVDEISELDPAALALVQRIARLGRAPGVQLIIATQRPSAQQLESTDESGTALRGQLHTRICMRVTETREADMILGSGLSREGWRADRLLREPGTFLIFDPPGHVKPVPARCFWMSDKTVQEAVIDCQEVRPTLDVGTASAVLPVADRGPEPGAPLEAGAEIVELRQDPETKLAALLRSAGEEGILAAEAAERIGRGKSWTFEALKRMATRGQAESVRGRWRFPPESFRC